MTPETAISFDRVSMIFGRKTPFADMRCTVLDDICLDVPRGTMLCLLGPSGCGKTTMVNLIMGKTVPTEGAVRVFGEQAPYPNARRRIGYMPQSDALYEDITSEENLRFFGSMEGLSEREIDSQMNELLSFARLQEHRKKIVKNFSGGMKRRLSLAIALISSPDLLVLDEPTVGLDPAHRMRIWNELRCRCESGASLFVTTHVMDEAERCDCVVLMNGGKIIETGTPAEIKERAGASSLEEAFLVLEGTAAANSAPGFEAGTRMLVNSVTEEEGERHE